MPLPDFVPLHLSQALVESFLEFYFENFEKLDVENFWPALTMTQKSKKLKIFFILYKIVLFLAESELYMFSAFF